MQEIINGIYADENYISSELELHSDYEFGNTNYGDCDLCRQAIYDDEDTIYLGIFKGYVHSKCQHEKLINNLHDYMKRYKYKPMKYYITRGGMTYWYSSLNNGRIRKRQVGVIA